MSKIHVIHENGTWVEPLRQAFAEFDLPYEEWFLHEGQLDLDREPPQGVFYNRMSASSHTRGHRYAPEYTAGVLAWLEAHDRRVVNNGRALQLEVSKIAQYTALSNFGIRTPRTIAAIGADSIVAAARKLSGSFGSFITKHNRAGKGLGVRLFHDVRALEDYVRGDEFEDSVDGITLVQEYIRAPEPFITRVEFVGGEFLYAVRVDTSLGFELCPADVCQVGDQFCPVGETPAPAAPAADAAPANSTSASPAPASSAPRFRIIEGFRHPIIDSYGRFLRANGIGIAGIEFIADERGELYTYDVNTNTNYNSAAEEEAGISGMRAIALYLGSELRKAVRRPALSAIA